MGVVSIRRSAEPRELVRSTGGCIGGMIGSGRGGELSKPNSVVAGGPRGRWQQRGAGRASLPRLGAGSPGAAEVGSGVRATERAGDLLLDLYHADVAVRLVVAEGHAEVVQEAERGILAQLQPFDQMARLALFRPAAPRDRWRV